MKILHIITSLKIGGAESALCNFLTRCRSQDLHLVAFFHSGPNLERLEKLGIKTYQIKGLASCYDPLAIMRLSKIIKTQKPDIIHTALFSSNIIGRILGYLHDIPIVSDLHGDVYDSGKARKFFEVISAPLANKIVSVSHSCAKSFEMAAAQALSPAKFTKIKSNHTVICNGIDSSSLLEKASKNLISRSFIGLEEDDFIVGAIGRLERIKAYDILIIAFHEFLNICKARNEKISKLKLVIIGDGKERESLEKLGEKLGIRNSIHFLGFKTDAWKFYKSFDCFAISSLSEGLSIALLEAMSFGLPIISTHKNFNEPHDVIKEGINGFLVKSKDHITFAKKLFFIYKNKKIRNDMHKENLKTVIEKFDISMQIKNYEKIYDEIIKN